MRKWYIFTVIILSFVCSVWAISIREFRGADVQAEIAKEVLRFHVRANSDMEEDQEIKLKVKSSVVSYLQPFMRKMKSVEEAVLCVENHLPEIKKVIHRTLGEENCRYGFHIAIMEDSFPKKTYGDCSFPAGNYDAVVITLGEGKGQNWWCMLYPGLCFFEETYAVTENQGKDVLKENLTDAAYTWITEESHVKIKFRTKWMNRLFHLEEQ